MYGDEEGAFLGPKFESGLRSSDHRHRCVMCLDQPPLPVWITPTVGWETCLPDTLETTNDRKPGRRGCKRDKKACRDSE
jgi:hypothetical protein